MLCGRFTLSDQDDQECRVLYFWEVAVSWCWRIHWIYCLYWRHSRFILKDVLLCVSLDPHLRWKLNIVVRSESFVFFFPGKIRSWYWFSEYGVVVYNIIGNRYCENIGRQHKSNNGIYSYFLFTHCILPMSLSFSVSGWILTLHLFFLLKCSYVYCGFSNSRILPKVSWPRLPRYMTHLNK